MKQTAVEWLVNQLDGENHLTENEIKRVIEQAKEMEKEQINDAFNESRLTHPIVGFKYENFEQYYNETFKK